MPIAHFTGLKNTSRKVQTYAQFVSPLPATRSNASRTNSCVRTSFPVLHACEVGTPSANTFSVSCFKNCPSQFCSLYKIRPCAHRYIRFADAIRFLYPCGPRVCAAIALLEETLSRSDIEQLSTPMPVRCFTRKNFQQIINYIIFICSCQYLLLEYNATCCWSIMQRFGTDFILWRALTTIHVC